MDTEQVKSRVYITNFAGHDFTKAEKYGELVFVTTGYVSFQSLDRIKFEIVESLKTSRPDDWLCLTGVPILQVVSAVVWFHMHNKVNLLVWDRKKRDGYRELILTEKNFDQILELHRVTEDQETH